MSFNRNTGLYEGFIYLVSNNINNKKYIGQTKRTVEERWSDHLSKLQSDVNYFHNAILKHELTKYTCKRIPKIKFSTPDVSIGLLNENSKLFLSPIENSILVYLTKEKLQVKILDECLFENLTWYYVDLPTTSDINCRGWVNKNNFSMLCNDIKNIPDNL